MIARLNHWNLTITPDDRIKWMQSGNSQAGEGQTGVSVAPKTGQLGNQSQITVSETRAIDDGGEAEDGADKPETRETPTGHFVRRAVCRHKLYLDGVLSEVMRAFAVPPRAKAG